VAFKETRDRKVDHSYPSLVGNGEREKPLASLVKESPPPAITAYAYRSFDRQWILADNRVADYLRPDLWRIHGDHQIYLASLFSQPLGSGPALTCCAVIPDLDYFRGSYGAKAAIPLYRSSDQSAPNITPGLLDLLAGRYGRNVRPEDFVAYLYGALSHPAFTVRYAKEMESREVRVPITKDPDLFEKTGAIGAHLLWLHTYGDRFVPNGKRRGSVPPGSARCTEAVPDEPSSYPEDFEYLAESKTLRVGTGRFASVSPEVFNFEVSGLKVVQSWLKYRMKQGAGKRSSPLDDIRPKRWTSQFTTELLEMLWVLEATIAVAPEQAILLDAIVGGDCFRADDLPHAPEELRKPPRLGLKEKDLFD
jgi:hypothetical protein